MSIAGFKRLHENSKVSLNNQSFTFMLSRLSCQQMAVLLCHSLLIDIEVLSSEIVGGSKF